MEKIIQSLISKANNYLKPIRNGLNDISKSPKFIKIVELSTPYKAQIKGAIALTCATAVVLSGSFAVNYFETHDNNLYATPSYSVLVDGEEVAKVRNPEFMEEAMSQLKTDLHKKYNLEVNLDSNVEISESTAKDSEIVQEAQLYDMLKSKVGYELKAYAIKINGQTVGVTATEKESQSIVDNVINHFTKNIDKASIVDVLTAEDVSVENVKVNSTDIGDPKAIENYIINGTNEKMTYTVKDGDSYWSIAENANMSLDELISANPTSDPAKIHIGDELNLIVPKPFINVQVKRKLSLEEKIKYDTKYEYVSYLYNDEKTVKTAGTYGVSKIEAIVTEENGLEIAREVVKETVISKPKSEIVITGTQDPPPKQGTGIFINPLPSSTISSRFGPRGKYFHSGLDMAKPTGSDIKAADGGTVSFVGYSGTYGNLVIIDHGAGFQTKYAHCSKILVSKGEKVYQGKIIAKVGTTGLTTGPHLHFEVRKYGTAMNPQSYIGSQYK